METETVASACAAGVSPWACAASIVTQIGWPFVFLIVVLLLFVLRGPRDSLGMLVSALSKFLDRTKKVKAGGVELEAVLPKELAEDKNLEVAGATAIETVEAAGRGGKDHELVSRLRKSERVSEPVSDYPYLMHQGAKISKSSDFPYIIKAWIEFDKEYGFGLDEVARVYYRLDPTFPKEDWVLVSEDHAKFFEIWMRVYGEFTIIAVVVLKDGRKFWLSRYLDLPGRPAD